MAFVHKRLVTVPTLSLKDNEPKFLRIDAPMYTGKQIEEGKEPATLANVTDLDTGEQSTLIVNTVLHGILDEEYPNGAYVGLLFSIERLPKRQGKAYNGFKVFEIEESSDLPLDSIDGDEKKKAKKSVG